jgi:hypothetical protein
MNIKHYFKSTCSLLLLLFCSFVLVAQERVVTGKITNDTGEPLANPNLTQNPGYPGPR